MGTDESVPSKLLFRSTPRRCAASRLLKTLHALSLHQTGKALKDTVVHVLPYINDNVKKLYIIFIQCSISRSTPRQDIPQIFCRDSVL